MRGRETPIVTASRRPVAAAADDDQGATLSLRAEVGEFGIDRGGAVNADATGDVVVVDAAAARRTAVALMVV